MRNQLKTKKKILGFRGEGAAVVNLSSCEVECVCIHGALYSHLKECGFVVVDDTCEYWVDVEPCKKCSSFLMCKNSDFFDDGYGPFDECWGINAGKLEADLKALDSMEDRLKLVRPDDWDERNWLS